MCGVFGWIGDPKSWRRAHRLLVEVAIASEERGKDAAGWAALNGRGQLRWQRRPGPAGDLFADDGFWALRGRPIVMAIGHARHATAGAPAVNGNNHPHLAGDWLVVHNGAIPHHRAIAACHGVTLTSECDSELLARVLAQYGDRRGPEICLALEGSQSVLAINWRSRRLLAWTNGKMPLVAFQVDEIAGLWWASTREIGEQALEAVGLEARFAVAKPGLVYRMEVSDGQVVIHPQARGRTDAPPGSRA